MAKKRVSESNRLEGFTSYIPVWQIKWLNENPEFLIHQFIRDKLADYIEHQHELEEGKKWLSVI